MKPHRPPWLRLLRFAGLALIVLITFVALVLSWFAWSGRREWAATKRDLLARGETLSAVELAPAAIPDADNYFGDDVWKELASDQTTGEQGDFAILKSNVTGGELAALADAHPTVKPPGNRNGRIMLADDVLRDGDESPAAARAALAILEPLTPLLARNREWLQRPGANAGLDYQAGFAMRVAHVHVLLQMAQALDRRARAELALGNPTAAARDARDALRLSHVLASEPVLISQLVRLAVLGFALPAIDRGIQRRAWSEEELAAFQRELERVDLPSAYHAALRTERGFFNEMMEQLRRNPTALDAFGVPVGSGPAMRAYLLVGGAADSATYNRILQAVIDAGERTGRLNQELADRFDPQAIKPWNLLTRMTVPAIAPVVRRTAERQDRVTMTLVACALERYRLAQSSYPESLAALAPVYLSKAPTDTVTGAPIRYARTGDGFQLWTPAWNETDDNATPADRDAKSGDWVWNVPANRPPR